MTTAQAAVMTHAAGKRAPRPAATNVAPQIGMAPVLTPTQQHSRPCACACGGKCPRCRRSIAVQAKLEVSQPGDTYELEADRIAEQVLQMQTAPCSCGG